jgi:hypothetical protein
MNYRSLSKMLILSLLVVVFAGCSISTGVPAGTTAPATAAPQASTPAPEATTDAQSEIFWEDANVTAPGELPIVKEPISLTVGMATNASVKDWATNEQTLYIEEVTGINLEFMDIAKDEYVTKIDLMVAAGGRDLPDLLIGALPMASLVKWGQDWFEPQEGEVSAYEEQNLVSYKTVITYKPRTWADVSKIYWANQGPRIYGVKLFFGQAQSADATPEQRAGVLDSAKDLFLSGEFVNDSKIVYGLTYNEEESEVIASVYTPVVTYVEESWARFILGDLDINSDAHWNAYLSELAVMDIDRAIAATQSCVDRMEGN